MDRRPANRHHLILALVIGSALGITVLSGKPSYVRDDPIAASLPRTFGEWTGLDVLHCQNRACLKTCVTDSIENAPRCQACGGVLSPVALAERDVLPEDTRIVRKLYRDVTGNEAFVTIVLTGEQRSSIHRPEWCLPGQGFRITGKSSMSASVAENARLGMTVLSLSRSLARESSAGSSNGIYAYWFIGHGHEYSNHLTRILAMAFDNVVRGVSYPWAYVSIGIFQPGSQEDLKNRLALFAAELYPHLLPVPPADSLVPSLLLRHQDPRQKDMSLPQ